VRIESLKPYYAIPPVDTIVCAPNNPNARVLRYTLRDDAGERFSHIYVKGSGAQLARQGNATGALSVPVEAVFADLELIARGIFRPLTICDPNVKNLAQAQARAIREAMLRKIEGQKIELEIRGFLTTAQMPWAVTQMVTVAIPAKNITGPYFVAGARFLQDGRGERTLLTLIEPGVL
jgi:prophage tail gpP-like protein